MLFIGWQTKFVQDYLAWKEMDISLNIANVDHFIMKKCKVFCIYDVCVAVYVPLKSFILLFSLRGDKMQAVNSEQEIDKVDFTGRMFFLPSNLLEEIVFNLEALNANT